MTQRNTEHFATLVEGGFDNALEELFIAAEGGGLVAHHADDGTLHLGRRIEYARLDGEQIFDVDRKSVV